MKRKLRQSFSFILWHTVPYSTYSLMEIYDGDLVLFIGCWLDFEIWELYSKINASLQSDVKGLGRINYCRNMAFVTRENLFTRKLNYDILLKHYQDKQSYRHTVYIEESFTIRSHQNSIYKIDREFWFHANFKSKVNEVRKMFTI